MAVEITGQTGTVSVGEKISQEVNYTKEWGVLKSVEWTIPGQIVKGYNGDAQRRVKVTKIEEVDKKRNPIHFYWVDGGDGRVVQAKCVFTSQGKDKNKTVSATFNVKRPKLDKFRSKTGTVGLRPSGAPTRLIFDLAKPGIQWDWKISADGAAEGKIRDIQLCSVNRRRTVGGKKQIWTRPAMKTPTPPGWLLDNENPYGSKGFWGAARGGPWTIPAGGSVSDRGIDDSPETGLQGTRKSAHDRFKYFLLYKSDKADSIWIAIGVLSWWWKGAATKGVSRWSLVPKKSTLGWSLVAGSAGNSRNPTGSETFDFPEWDHVAPNDLTWVDE